MGVNRIPSSSKISWSKNGFIAYSDLSSSTNLSITKLGSIKGSSWRISPKKTYEVKPNPSARLHQLTHVQWSTYGNELALVDTMGNVTILGSGITKQTNSTTGINSTQSSCYEDVEIIYQDPISGLNGNGNGNGNSSNKHQFNTTEYFTGALSFNWLNVDKPIISNAPASRINQNYNYVVHQYKSQSTFHPIPGRSGFLIIRRNDVLNFYYQTNNPIPEYKKISLNLENLENNWLEFASIGYNRDGSVTIATFNKLTNKLNIYKLTIDWRIPQNVKIDQQTKVDPILKIERLISKNLPTVGKNGLKFQLVSLNIVSPNFAQDTELDIFLIFEGDGVINGKSLIQKYQVSNELKNFKFLTNAHDLQGYKNLQLICEIIHEEKILNITSKNFDFLIVLTTEGGNIEIRHRNSLKSHVESPSSITSLIDVGFKFKKFKEIPESILLSPSLCGYLYLKNHELKFYNIFIGEKAEDDSYWTDEKILEISAGFAYTFAITCFTNVSADELIITIQNELSKIKDSSIRSRLVFKILEETHRGLNFSLEHSKDHIDKLLVSPPFQRLLSLQYSLGKYTETNEQSLIATNILNLRLVAFSIMLSMRTLFHQQQRIARKGNIENISDSIYRSESLLSTIGIVNWFVEFLIFNIRELIEVLNDNNYKTIIFGLLLSKIPRSLMNYAISGIKRVDGLLSGKLEEITNNKNMNNTLQLDFLLNSYSRLKYLLNLSDFTIFENFLNQIEIIFVKTSTDPTILLKIEQELIFKNKIPNEFKNLIPQLLNKFQEFYKDHDLSKYYFHDINWMNNQVKLSDIPIKTLLDSEQDQIPILFNLNDVIIDDVTKIIINDKSRLKRCSRCEHVTADSSISEFNFFSREFNPGSNQNQYWPFAFQRNCICGSCWVYVNPDEVAI